MHAAAVSPGEAHALSLPTAPTATSASSRPASAKTVKVSATTSWTTAVLATGSYFSEVLADVGTIWASAKSAATAQRTISSSACS